MVPKEIFTLLSLFIVNFYFKSSIFFFILSSIYMCGSGSVFRIRIRIQKAPEYGSITDPDPQHCPSPSRSGRQKLQNTIHFRLSL